MIYKVFISLFTVLALFSCGKKKTAFSPEFQMRSTEELVQFLDELNHSEWDFLSTKANVKISSERQNNSFKASVRMKRDSAMLVNISFAGFPIIQSILSSDSLKLLNRKDKCYSYQDKRALDNLIDFPVEYEQIQDILIGQPLLFNKNEEHIQIQNKQFYELKGRRKRTATSNDFFELTYLISPKTLNLEKVILDSSSDEMRMEISYFGKHEKTQGLMLPEIVEIVIIGPQGKTSLVLNYSKPDVSQEKKITLNLPENYVPCP